MRTIVEPTARCLRRAYPCARTTSPVGPGAGRVADGATVVGGAVVGGAVVGGAVVGGAVVGAAPAGGATEGGTARNGEKNVPSTIWAGVMSPSPPGRVSTPAAVYGSVATSVCGGSRTCRMISRGVVNWVLSCWKRPGRQLPDPPLRLTHDSIDAHSDAVGGATFWLTS